MIEYRTKSECRNANFYNESNWFRLRVLSTRSPGDFSFSFCEYKIGGIVFKEYSTAFREAYEKELFWMRLQKCQNTV